MVDKVKHYIEEKLKVPRDILPDPPAPTTKNKIVVELPEKEKEEEKEDTKQCADGKCVDYQDVVPNPTISSNWRNKNKNRYMHQQRKKGYHKGVDIHTGPIYVDVHSLLCGEVVDYKDSIPENHYIDNSLGNVIVIKSKDKEGKEIYIMYCHLNKVYVKKNQKVVHGQVIAQSGSTGNAAELLDKKGEFVHGIHREFWHIHIEASRKYIPGSCTFINVASHREDPEKFMKTKFDDKGNPIS